MNLKEALKRAEDSSAMDERPDVVALRVLEDAVKRLKNQVYQAYTNKGIKCWLN